MKSFNDQELYQAGDLANLNLNVDLNLHLGEQYQELKSRNYLKKIWKNINSILDLYLYLDVLVLPESWELGLT